MANDTYLTFIRGVNPENSSILTHVKQILRHSEDSEDSENFKNIELSCFFVVSLIEKNKLGFFTFITIMSLSNLIN